MVEIITRMSSADSKAKCATDILRYLQRHNLDDEVNIYTANRRYSSKGTEDVGKASEYISGADDDLLAISFDGSEFLRQYRYGNGGYSRPRVLKELNRFLERRNLKLELLDWMGYVREIEYEN